MVGATGLGCGRADSGETEQGASTGLGSAGSGESIGLSGFDRATSTGSNSSSDATGHDLATTTAGTESASGLPPDTTSGTVDSGTTDSTGTEADHCAGDSGLTPQQLLANIDTVVVVMMENRSFDHCFGAATLMERWPLNGLTGTESNLDLSGREVQVFHMENLEVADPPHDWEAVHDQWNLGENDGFVREHQRVHANSREEVMGYYSREQLPISYALAENYTLCDGWFSSVMGPTWPNRFYLHCGTSGGVTNNRPNPVLTTIWASLAQAGVTARNYYSDVAWATGAFLPTSPVPLAPLEEFFAAAEQGSLPQYCLVDPNFGILNPAGANDDHPDHNVTMGQLFLSTIYAALAQSPQWDRCLLVITYDEHGGFYDHVNPPTTEDAREEFRQLGFRVPAMVIGPQVRRGCVNSSQLEHVSVLSTLTAKHGLVPLNDRVAATRDLSCCIDPAYIDDPQPPAPIPRLAASLNDLLAVREDRSHPEMRELVATRAVILPESRQGPEAGRKVAMSLIEHAQRLGALKLRNDR